MKKFPIEAVLSLSDGRLMCAFDDLHRLIEHVAGRPVWTHELASRGLVEELAGRIQRQHPWLTTAALPTSAAKGQAFLDALAPAMDALRAAHGKEVEVEGGKPPEVVTVEEVAPHAKVIRMAAE